MAVSDNWAVWGRDEHLEELFDQQNWHHIGLDAVPGRRPPAKNWKTTPKTGPCATQDVEQAPVRERALAEMEARVRTR